MSVCSQYRTFYTFPVHQVPLLGLLNKLLVIIGLNLFTSAKIGCLNPGLNFINDNTYVFPPSTVSDQTDELERYKMFYTVNIHSC